MDSLQSTFGSELVGRLETLANKLNLYIDFDAISVQLIVFQKEFITNEILKELICTYNKGYMNRCGICYEDMGYDNPRQLCGKYKCTKEIHDE